MIPVYSVIAYSGTGKTTFLEKLIPILKQYGLKVAVVKHDAHDFEIDKEGKDSYRLTKAGTTVTGLVSNKKAVLMENREKNIEDVIDSIQDVDLILTEGYKLGPWPKIMLHRKATGKELPLDPANCFAVASDVKIEGAKHFFHLDDVRGIAALLYEEWKNYKINLNLRIHKIVDDALLEFDNFSEVGKSTLDGVWYSGRIESMKKGTIVYHAGKNANMVFIQLTGKSMIYNCSHSGNRKILMILGRGDLLNDRISFGRESSLYCEILEDSKLFLISKNSFLRWMARDHHLMKAVLSIQELKMARLTHQLKNSSSNIKIEKKLASKLWKLARDFGRATDDGVEIELKLSVTLLADLLGVPRESASRACKELVHQKLLRMEKKRALIFDMVKLKEFYYQ